MANTYAQILKAGTQSNYDALATKDNNVLYFCTDTSKIYKGSTDFTNNVIVAASKPAAPVAGKIYILSDTNTVEVYANGAWQVISYPLATELDVNSDDVHVVSAKAVYDAIQEAVEGITGGTSIVKDVAASATAGSISVTKGDGTATDIAISGVVVNPTWDNASRKLTLPVNGGDSVVVEIGKDIFVDPEADNKYNPETGNIELHLNDGTTIEVPASALVDVYEGVDSTSATTTISDDNKVTVAIKLDPDTKNAIAVTENGLIVDLSAYAKAADVQSEIDAVRTTANAADTLSKANKAAIDILNGTTDVEGSVAKQVADAKNAVTAITDNHETRIQALEGASAETNENVAALATAATTWGTF